MPRASRAWGDRICRTGVLGGACFLEGRFAAGFLEDERVLEARDDERREGEVFVAIDGEV
jgi:hypothetical protein